MCKSSVRVRSDSYSYLSVAVLWDYKDGLVGVGGRKVAWEVKTGDLFLVGGGPGRDLEYAVLDGRGFVFYLDMA